MTLTENALDFLKIDIEQPFSHERLVSSGAQTTYMMGDLDLLFRVTGVKTYFGYMPTSPILVKIRFQVNQMYPNDVSYRHNYPKSVMRDLTYFCSQERRFFVKWKMAMCVQMVETRKVILSTEHALM